MPRAYTENQLVTQHTIGLFAELGWIMVSELSCCRERELPLRLVAGQGALASVKRAEK